jgi:serine/threonine protein kinase
MFDNQSPLPSSASAFDSPLPSSASAFDSPPAVPDVGGFDSLSAAEAAKRWKVVEELFHASAAVPESHRGPYLALACAGDALLQRDVESLLAFDQEGNAARLNNGRGFGSRLAQLVDRTKQELNGPEESVTGTRVGPYIILRELGQGGMGTVYLAERADGQFQQRVALKVVNGLCSKTGRERFLVERQLLANLVHPNVARLLDGGETEQGQPYFAMEYLEGESITAYFARRGSSTAERLEVFEQVCAAVHYAHQKLAIHRDLKPDNILITTVESVAVAKVLDFGIAKLIDAAAPEDPAHLTAEPRVMTPCYASPEQYRGRPVSTSTDVYSLGAVLYEVLSGHRPYDLQGMSPAEMERDICEEDPLPPSRAVFREGGRRNEPPMTLFRELRGDLDKITAMAMAKEPEQRYGSAQALADDLRRYRLGFPVRAHAGGFFYRLKKQWTRNRLAFSAAAVLLLSWLVGTVMVLRESHLTAQREAQVRNLAAALLLDVPEQSSGLTTEERTAVVKQALESLSQLARDRRNDPALELQRATAYERVGDLQGHPMARSLGDSVGAEKSYQASLEILDRLAKAHPRDIAVMHQQIRVRYRLGVLYRDARGSTAAADCLRKGAEIADVALAAAPRDDALHSDAGLLFEALGRVYTVIASFEESAQMLDRAFAIYRDLLARDPTNWNYRDGLANCYGGRMTLNKNTGKLQESLQDARENLRLRQGMAQDSPRNPESRRNLMLAYARIGDILGYPPLVNLGDPRGAAVYMRQMLALAESLAGDDPTDRNALFDLGMSRQRLALTLIAAGERQEAEPQLRAGWEVAQRLLQADPTHKRYLMIGATFQEYLGEAAGLAGHPSEAHQSFDVAETLCEKVHDAESLVTSQEIELLRLQMEARQMDLAEFARTESRLAGMAQHWEEVTPRNPGRAYDTYAQMGQLNEKIGNKEHARQWYEKSLEGWRKLQEQKSVPPHYAQEPERVAHLLQALTSPSAKLRPPRLPETKAR